MSKSNHPVHQLQRGQAYIEYLLVTVLIAVVAIPAVSILANPADFREGAIYNQIYVPMLCAVQGRGECSGVGDFDYGYPTKSGTQDLAESGGDGESGGLGGEDESGDDTETVENPEVLEIRNLEIVGESPGGLPPGTYSFLAEATGGADDVTITVTRDPDGTPTEFASQTIAGDGEYETTPLDEFTLADTVFSFTDEGTYRVSAFPSKADVDDGATVTIDFTIDQSLHPDDDSNLFGSGFQVYNASTDSLETAITPGLTLQPGTWEIVGLTTGGTPASVDIAITGDLTQTTTGLTEAPYAMFGHSEGDYTGFDFPVGNYTVTLTPYDETGDAGTPASADFEVFQPDPISVTRFSIIDATNNDPNVLGTLGAGQQMALTGDEISFAAIVDGPVESVKLSLTDITDSSNPTDIVTDALEGAEPYTLFGDSGGNFSGEVLAEGDYRLSATAYYNDAGTGTGSDEFSVDFSVGPWTGQRIAVTDDNASVVGAFQMLSDGGRNYAVVPNSENLSSTSNSDNATVNDNYVEFQFNVPSDGDYSLWAMVEGPAGQDDSFWVKYDTQTLRYWSGLPSNWGEDRVTHDGAGSTDLTMSKGENIVRFHLREDGTKIEWAELRPAS